MDSHADSLSLSRDGAYLRLDTFPRINYLIGHYGRRSGTGNNSDKGCHQTRGLLCARDCLLIEVYRANTASTMLFIFMHTINIAPLTVLAQEA